MVKPSNRFSDAEDIIKRDVKMLLEYVVQKVALSETNIPNPVSGESYKMR